MLILQELSIGFELVYIEKHDYFKDNRRKIILISSSNKINFLSEINKITGARLNILDSRVSSVFKGILKNSCIFKNK